MKAYVPSYDMKQPRDVAEALKMLSDHSGSQAFSGGTDLMVQFESGRLPEGMYINIFGLSELRFIKTDADHVEIGAGTTYSEIREHAFIQKHFPLLVEAAKLTGAIAIQNRGTIGGNIANASPAADTPPALLSYQTEIILISKNGKRSLPYEQFHHNYKKTALATGELIHSVRVKIPAHGARQFYRKVGTRSAQAISKICMAACVSIDANKTIADIQIGWGSMAPTPKRSDVVGAALRGQTLSAANINLAVSKLTQDLTPIDDVRSDKMYRMTVAQNILRQYLESLL
jgi:CO/xanthine dehydrogenase FAD-binding subunit